MVVEMAAYLAALKVALMVPPTDYQWVERLAES